MLRIVTAFVCLASLGCASAPPASKPAVSSDSRTWAEKAAVRLPMLAVCRPPNVAEDVLCGTLDVPEDRQRPDGRRLTLDVVVVPAQTDAPPADPVFVFEGGPGGAVTQRAASMVYAGPVRTRDIVLVDQRGTAGSHRLDCPLGGGDTELGQLAEMFPADDVRRCATALAAQADLRRYTTLDFVADIEAARRHLGYGPINIRGGSYGTRAMMVFAQRYPRSTRSLFGIGVVSPLRPNLAARGAWAERTLETLGERCATEATCADLVADLHGATAALLGSLDAGPRRVTLADPQAPDATLTLDVERAWLAESLRLVLYFGFSSRALPWAVHRAQRADDWQPLVQLAVLMQRMFQSSLAYGVLLTVQCGEGMGFDVDAALASEAKTLMGSYRLAQQVQGCAQWPHETRPALGVADPRVLDLPTLFLSGALDPVTPPAYGDDAATLFPNSHHVVLADGHHGPFDLVNGWICVHELWADFLDRGGVEGLATSCTETMWRPPFLVDAEAFERYLVDELVPMVG